MKTNKIKIVLKLFVLFLFIALFYNINIANYEKHIDIKQNLVEHPENLPTKKSAHITSFWFKNLRADLFWLQTIQYIWWNAVSSEYKKYLYHIIDLVTELNPYFEHPYLIAQLLLPSYNERYENLSEEEIDKHEKEALSIGLKWIRNFCPDSKKLNAIINEDDLKKLWTDEKYLDPCMEPMIPYYQAYIHYFYRDDPITASNYYKIASANSWSLWWAKTMAAIMQWKWWNRQKSFFMFLNVAKYLDSSDEVCHSFQNYLEKLWEDIFVYWYRPLNWEEIKKVEEIRKEIFWEFQEEREEEILSDTKCWSYVNKAVRELNLAYIEEWNKKYMEDHVTGLPARHAKALFDEWYIDFLPTDFQQYKDYGIIYEYNYDTKNYDYSMWTYD